MEVKVISKNSEPSVYNLNGTISGYDLLHNYYQKNEKTTIAYFLNGQLKDLYWPIENDSTVEFVDKSDEISWSLLNYTCALVLAAAVENIFPNATIALANSNNDGFTLDFDYETKLKQQDLLKLNSEMNKILKKQFAITRVCQKLDEVLETFANNEFVKEYSKLKHLDGLKCHYLINNKTRVTASNVAINNSNVVKAFSLQTVTGAYWLGNDKNKQLQRISGICHWNQELLNSKIEEIAQRKARDHRILGEKLKIFTFNDEIGKGLPIFLPNGLIIKKELQNYLREQEFKWDCQEVSTPVLGSVQLYKTSGHWDHYQENMFTPIVKDDEQLVLRPMTCPHHCMIYKSAIRSYRDLPLRFSEHALLYRYEISGALTGLERVRAMELTDCHIFARADQMKSEFKTSYQLIDNVLSTLGIEIDYLSLSLRDKNDKEKYHNDDEMWDKAESALREVLDELKLPYKEMVGEAAFYGPKLDIQIKTPLGHEITISTIQFDFLLPKRFDLKYIDSNNEEVNPIIVHRGLIGTYERFIATLLEQTQGVFPLWLAPKQVIILPINNSDEIMNYSNSVHKILKDNNIRSEIFANETIGKRIKISHENKIPYIIIIGQKELQEQNLTYHTYLNQKENLSSSQNDFLNLLLKEIKLKK